MRAIVGETRTDNQSRANALDPNSWGNSGNTGSIQATTLDSDNFMEINGVKIGCFSFENHDATGELTRQINSHYDETGVLAEVNASGELVLIAKDGRDISISTMVVTDPNGFGALEANSGTQGNLMELLRTAQRSLYNQTKLLKYFTDNAVTLNESLGGMLNWSTLRGPMICHGHKIGCNHRFTIDLSAIHGAVRALDVN